MGPMFCLNKDIALPAPGTKIIKAKEAMILVEAGNLLEEARSRALKILTDAQQAYEEQKEKGYQDGLEEGRLEHAEKVLDTVLSSVEYIENLESTLVKVVGTAVRKIIGELEDGECIVRIVRNALLTVRGQQKVVIRVAMKDEPYVKKSLDSITRVAPGISFLDLVADPRLAPGSCILESELGVVDASLETQLKAIEKSITARIKG